MANFCYSLTEFSHFGAAPYKAPQTEILSIRMLKVCQYQHKTNTDKQKKQKALRLSEIMHF
jgi:hypothetical protein